MWPFFTRVFVPSFLVILATLLALSHGQGGTRVGFYQFTCPAAELVVESVVRSSFSSDPTIAPALLRLHFQDCFVQGCDGSILINGTNTEKTAEPNRLLRGYEVIDDAKSRLEALCPGVVSCADILALAARDSVVLTGGTSWLVPLGRRDGLVSLASDTFTNLPNFTDSVADQIDMFQSKGLNTEDLVTLVGAHTIGTSACQFFRYRLYNFTSTSGPDPTIAPEFLPTLQALCPANGDASRRVALDDRSEGQFDASFFTNVRNGRAVLESDQRLFGDASTRNVVQRYFGLGGLTFTTQFGRSMAKMSNIQVKTGGDGEIRTVCYAIN